MTFYSRDTYSGKPDGDMTMLMTSWIREAFMMRSLVVVKAMDGDALTCIQNGGTK